MTACGEQCVIHIGTEVMQRLYVTSWVTLLVSTRTMYILQSHHLTSCPTASTPFYNSFFGPGTATNTWSDVGGCRGTENNIFRCSFTTPVDCNSSNFAGVRCYGMAGYFVSVVHVHVCIHMYMYMYM